MYKGERNYLLTKKLILIVSIAMAFYHLYFALIGFITEMSWRSGHLMFAMVLIFLIYPVSKKLPRERLSILDVVLILLALIVGIYMIVQYPKMSLRMGAPIFWDLFFGGIALGLVLEITRRTLGLPLVLIGIFFILYCFVGPYLPGMLSHRGFDSERILTQMYCTLDGIYGLPIGVMVKYVYFFILFAGFLEATGAGKWFIDLAYALTGRTRSGPALTAVMASAFMGSVSGSAVANTVGTGSFTIPLMKKVGYKPHIAGAIEAAASTGGQLMPPIMGAAAFIISEWTGIPYLHIVKVSVIPALLYFLSVAFFVQIVATKEGIQPLSKEKIPSLKMVLPKGLHYFTGIAVLVILLVRGYSPTYAVCLALFALICGSYFKKESRMKLKDILESLEKAARKAIPVSAACACAGVVVGSVGLTGLGLRFSAMVTSLAGGNWIIGVILVMLASLFLGMGLPVTASYVVLAVLAVPGLKALGISMLAAHLIVFWYSQDANVTPPVCLAAYAASGIAGSTPMRTGFASWRLAKGMYIIPFLFVYTPILFNGSPLEIIITTFKTAAALFCFAVSMEGHLLRNVGILQRVLIGFAAIFLLLPNLILVLVGGLVMVAILIIQMLTVSQFRIAHFVSKQNSEDRGPKL